MFNHTEDIFKTYEVLEEDTVYTPADVADLSGFNVRKTAIFLKKLVEEKKVKKVKIMPHFKTIFEYGYIKEEDE